MDFSPVAHWTQGAARVAQALLGTMEQKKLDRADRQNMTAEQSILQSLAGTGAVSGTGAGAGAANDPAMLAAMSSPYMSDRARDAVKLQWQASHKTPAQPHYWETNNGSLGVIGPDGKPQVLYKDPDSKMNFVPDGMGGGSWVAIPSQSAGAPPAAVPAAPVRPVGKLTPITGGAPSQGGATFP